MKTVKQFITTLSGEPNHLYSYNIGSAVVVVVVCVCLFVCLFVFVFVVFCCCFLFCCFVCLFFLTYSQCNLAKFFAMAIF